MQDANEIEFTPPKGFRIPKTVKPGGTFSATATLELQTDGSLELVALDGIKFPDPDESEDETKDSDSGDNFSDAVAKGVYGQ